MVQEGKKLCDFFGIQGRDRDQILAGLALHDIMKFATLDAVKATPRATTSRGPRTRPRTMARPGAYWVEHLDPAMADLAKPIAHYIDDHMATWNATPTPPPDINDLIVSLSDYVASLPNFYLNV